MPGEALAFMIVLYMFICLFISRTHVQIRTVRRGVLVSRNVDGSRTSGVGLFGADRGLSGCALSI